VLRKSCSALGHGAAAGGSRHDVILNNGERGDQCGNGGQGVPAIDEAGPFQIRHIEKRERVSGRDVGLSKLVAEEKMAAVIKSAKLRELAAMTVAQAGQVEE
jgi:hypothetical protein